MPRPNLEGFGDILSRLLAPHLHKPAFQLALCQNAWRTLLGEAAVQKTRKLTFSDGILIAYLNSDSLRHELRAQQTRLLQGLQEELKDQLEIKELVLK
ncbi:MAG: hypothetical protein RL206_499 [Bacteroidota bacterium]|jgi:predicted nucleic acid-binding Zn ribbon protein